MKERASLVAQTVKNPPANAGDPGSIPGSGRSSGEGNGYPLQYSRPENPMDREAWIKRDSPDTENPDSGEEEVTHQRERPQTTYNYNKSLESWKGTDMLDTHHQAWQSHTRITEVF